MQRGESRGWGSRYIHTDKQTKEDKEERENKKQKAHRKR